MPRAILVPIAEHVRDYDGDWQRALMGVVYSTMPAAEVVGNRIYERRGRPILNVFLPDELDQAEAEAARIGAACDEHIKQARRKAALGAMRAIDMVAELPDGLPPQEKGKLLLRYAEHGTPVQGLDFSGAVVPPGADLSNANMKGGNFRSGVFERVILNGADLRGALLLHARVAGAQLRIAKLHEADLRHADLKGVDLRGAELHRVGAENARLVNADLLGADLRGTRFFGATLHGARLDDAYLSDVKIDAVTYERSDWGPADLQGLLTRGVDPGDQRAYPAEAREVIGPDRESLTFFFPSTLDFLSEALFRSVLAFVLGEDGPACRSEYTPTETGGAIVRLSGLPIERLVRIADRLAGFFDRPARAEITQAIERAVEPAVDRAIERNLPDVVARAVAPMAVLQAQIGERIVRHIEAIYSQVDRTEIKLSDEIVEALRKLEYEVIEARLDRSGWAWDAAAGKLVRAGGWAVGTGAVGSGLVEILMWLATKT